MLYRFIVVGELTENAYMYITRSPTSQHGKEHYHHWSRNNQCICAKRLQCAPPKAVLLNKVSRPWMVHASDTLAAQHFVAMALLWAEGRALHAGGSTQGLTLVPSQDAQLRLRLPEMKDSPVYLAFLATQRHALQCLSFLTLATLSAVHVNAGVWLQSPAQSFKLL